MDKTVRTVLLDVPIPQSKTVRLRQLLNGNPELTYEQARMDFQSSGRDISKDQFTRVRKQLISKDCSVRKSAAPKLKTAKAFKERPAEEDSSEDSPLRLMHEAKHLPDIKQLVNLFEVRSMLMLAYKAALFKCSGSHRLVNVIFDDIMAVEFPKHHGLRRST